MSGFAHLHAYSWFSFLRGGSSPEALISRAKNLNQNALAITDYMSVAGAVRFQVAAREAKLKSIIGSEILLEGHNLVLIAADNSGYGTLNRLLTHAHKNREHPELSFSALADDNAGLFLLTGYREGKLWQSLEQNRLEGASDWLDQLSDIMPKRVFVELATHQRPGEQKIVHRLSQLAKDKNLPTLATNAARHATAEEYKIHDLLSCVRLKIRASDLDPQRPVNAEAYLKSGEQILKLVQDASAVSNTEFLARECEVNLLPGEITPPGATIPLGMTGNGYLFKLCREGLERKYSGKPERFKAEELFAKEFGVISQLDLSEFFLVVHEVVHFARSRRIRCAGRGSAANSIVAYLLDITTVCPVHHRLLFERFLHAGRKGTPDIDVDFDTSRRDEVIDWMIERFSVEHTAMTANVNTYGLRGAVQDVAKVLGWSNDIAIHRLTKGLSGHATPADVREYKDKLSQVVGEVPLLEALLTLVEKLEGCPRHLSLHSGGMILSREELWKFSPVQFSANGVQQATFNKDDVEYLGLVKLDVLGLRAMSAISYAQELIEQTTGHWPDLDSLSVEDPKVYDLICSGETLSLFQVESPGQMALIAKLQPRTFHELAIQIAILRPGPIQGGVLQPYVRRAKGLEKSTPPHASLKEVLSDTHGMILYQEQVLEVSHAFAGLPMEEADEFRRLMSKSRSPKQMETMREKFVSSARHTHSDVSEKLANEVFDKVSKFTGYGFPKSHAAAFARTVYHTAWLKCYFPAAYLAAVMRYHPGMFPRQAFITEARRFGVEVLPCDATQSQQFHGLEKFADKYAIRLPLTDVKEVGVEDADHILWQRASSTFESLEDFYRRCKINREAIFALAKAGALDNIPTGDSTLFEEEKKTDSRRRDVLWRLGVMERRLGLPGQGTLPLLNPVSITPQEIAQLAELTPIELMAWDIQYSSATAGPHPIALKRYELTMAGVVPIDRAVPDYEGGGKNKLVTVAGIVIARQRPESGKGVVFITIEDETGRIQCCATPEQWTQMSGILRKGNLILTGTVQRVNNWKGMTLHRAAELRYDIELGMAGSPGALPRKERVA